jgi:hypothetical protein
MPQKKYLEKCSGSSGEIRLYKPGASCNFAVMKWKKFLPLVPVLLLTGCASTFTRLTPLEQPRNPDNVYPVEVAFKSPQQSLRWDSLKPFVLVNGVPSALQQVPLVQNRWQGYISVPPGTNSVHYRFKFDYLYNTFGSQPQPDSAYSPVYQLRIVGQ